jgi:hypothetical protein
LVEFLTDTGYLSFRPSEWLIKATWFFNELFRLCSAYRCVAVASGLVMVLRHHLLLSGREKRKKADQSNVYPPLGYFGGCSLGEKLDAECSSWRHD